MALLAVGVFLGSSQPSPAVDTVGFTRTNNGNGTWTYLWTVVYDGLNPTGYGQLEVYFPFAHMGTGSDANGGGMVGVFSGGLGTNVTLPENAAFYSGTHAAWTQARLDLESPDQEGFDPPSAEIGFFMNGQDTVAATYQYSYVLDAALGSFFYELHDSREADEGRFQEGVVPLPPGVLLLGSGLLGMGLLRLRGRKS